MIYIEIMGGLGNQLFQIFCGISYSLENKIPFKINANKFDLVSPLDNISQRPTYWNNFLVNLSTFTYQDQLTIPTYIEKTHFRFKKIPSITQDFRLHGYYQSYKYFDEQYANICKMINLDNQKAAIFEKHKMLLDTAKKPISLHFRIGDYVKNQATHPILSNEYYIKSLNYLKSQLPDFEENYYLLIFGESCDNEKIAHAIKSIKAIYTIAIVICDYSIPDYEQLLLMSLTSHNIIANSTFSWWGAYFNTNVNKIVCYPSLWNGSNNNVNDLFPYSWIKIL
jgi:hypothetical protein|uniref:Alpha-1,2-fucosyltransferase n=1 Tax=viral metagenome TaxID=1070528 RepID=A0A6C0H412_9ZZZZ